MNRYLDYYQQIICEDLLLKQNYKNIFELPKLERIVINTTSKQYVQDKKEILSTLVINELISGQKSKLTTAKKSIAGFKIRQGQILGCKTTLRKDNMYRFLNSFITIVLPRLRDLQGIPKKSFDKFGNLSIGVQNLMIFPELENNFEYFQNIKGIHLNYITNTKKHSFLLYTAFQIPVM